MNNKVKSILLSFFVLSSQCVFGYSEPQLRKYNDGDYRVLRQLGVPKMNKMLKVILDDNHFKKDFEDLVLKIVLRALRGMPGAQITLQKKYKDEIYEIIKRRRSGALRSRDVQNLLGTASTSQQKPQLRPRKSRLMRQTRRPERVSSAQQTRKGREEQRRFQASQSSEQRSVEGKKLSKNSIAINVFDKIRRREITPVEKLEGDVYRFRVHNIPGTIRNVRERRPGQNDFDIYIKRLGNLYIMQLPCLQQSQWPIGRWQGTVCGIHSAVNVKYLLIPMSIEDVIQNINSVKAKNIISRQARNSARIQGEAMLSNVDLEAVSCGLGFEVVQGSMGFSLKKDSKAFNMSILVPEELRKKSLLPMWKRRFPYYSLKDNGEVGLILRLAGFPHWIPVKVERFLEDPDGVYHYAIIFTDSLGVNSINEDSRVKTFKLLEGFLEIKRDVLQGKDILKRAFLPQRRAEQFMRQQGGGIEQEIARIKPFFSDAQLLALNRRKIAELDDKGLQAFILQLRNREQYFPNVGATKYWQNFDNLQIALEQEAKRRARRSAPRVDNILRGFEKRFNIFAGNKDQLMKLLNEVLVAKVRNEKERELLVQQIINRIQSLGVSEQQAAEKKAEIDRIMKEFGVNRKVAVEWQKDFEKERKRLSERMVGEGVQEPKDLGEARLRVQSNEVQIRRKYIKFLQDYGQITEDIEPYLALIDPQEQEEGEVLSVITPDEAKKMFDYFVEDKMNSIWKRLGQAPKFRAEELLRIMEEKGLVLGKRNIRVAGVNNHIVQLHVSGQTRNTCGPRSLFNCSKLGQFFRRENDRQVVMRALNDLNSGRTGRQITGLRPPVVNILFDDFKEILNGNRGPHVVGRFCLQR